MTERALWVRRENVPLYGMMHDPGSGARGLMLVCAPLFEERKSAHRPLVEWARAACDAGWRTLRFDYRGCGDSSGSFREATMDDWDLDVLAAAEELRKTAPDAPLVVLGLRMGACLAARLSAVCAVDAMVFWEPVLNGHAYLMETLRKKLMKDMLTDGGARQSRDALIEALEAGQQIDVDGYALAPGLYHGMKQLDLLSETGAASRRALLMHVSHRAEIPENFSRLRDALAARGCQIKADAVKLQPFWNLVGYTSITPLMDATLQWLKAAFSEKLLSKVL